MKYAAFFQLNEDLPVLHDHRSYAHRVSSRFPGLSYVPNQEVDQKCISKIVRFLIRSQFFVAQFAMEFCAEESCGKCTPCRIGPVRGVELLEMITAARQNGIDSENEKQLLLELCETMEQASLCAMGGMTPFPVRSAIALDTSDSD